MNVFVLGGYGKTGYQAVKLLLNSGMVDRIAVAGRDLVQAEKAAKELGGKVIPVRADSANEQELTSLLGGYDILLNAASNVAVLPSIRAAIQNRAHYCDLSWGNILDEAKQLDSEAKAAGITAIIATGVSPCISNLMGVHAAGQLDEVEQLQIGRSDLINFQTGQELTPLQWQKEPEESLETLQVFKPFIGWQLKRVQDEGIHKVLDFQDGGWVEIDPLRDDLEVLLAQGGKSKSRPYLSGMDIFGALPADLSRVTSVELSFSPFPEPLNNLLLDHALDVLCGIVDVETALTSFYKTIENDPAHWLTAPDDFVAPVRMWISAVGWKEGQAARCDCWFTAPMRGVNGYFLTSVSLVAAARKIMCGEVSKRGVLTAEKAFEPLLFLEEVVTLIPDLLPEGEIIDEAFVWMK